MFQWDIVEYTIGQWWWINDDNEDHGYFMGYLAGYTLKKSVNVASWDGCSSMPWLPEGYQPLAGYESSQLEVCHDISCWTINWGCFMSGFLQFWLASKCHALENHSENELEIQGTQKSYFPKRISGAKPWNMAPNSEIRWPRPRSRASRESRRSGAWIWRCTPHCGPACRIFGENGNGRIIVYHSHRVIDKNWWWWWWWWWWWLVMISDD